METMQENEFLMADSDEREGMEKTLQRLRESEERLRQITSSLREAVWLRDIKTLEVLYVNPAYETIWGRTCESFYGDPTSFVEAIHPEDKARVMQAIQEQYHGKFFDEEYRIIRPDGEIRWIWGRTLPVEDAAGQVSRIVAIAEDITARKQAEEALRQRTAELQARNKELDAFAHTVAHDLQNALALVIGYADVLVHDHASLSSEELERYMQAIEHSGRKMSAIIDGLLLLAGVRKGSVEMEPLDMPSIVAEVRGGLAPLIEAEQAEIVAPKAWPAALGYRPWVEEVWVNYISNAIEYGGRPPRVELGAEAQPGGMIRFWVRDNGRGLTPTEQGRLFVPFTRLWQVSAKGHGLGLSIVQRIVEKLGGQVGVESEGVPGRGSVFSFTLPGVSPLACDGSLTEL
jgi:PAS domain S-box-containing protein